MKGLCPCSKSNSKTYAKSGAVVGSQVGARVGARVGPVATGLSSGLGGAVGYLAGSAVDAATGDVSAVTPIPDGGRPADDDRRPTDGSDGVAIPVTGDDG